METFRGMIAKRRSGEESFEDFLQSMLEKDSCPTNEKLSDSEIMDNLLTLIIAGQTTTAAAMMWSVKFLHDNREAQQKLRVLTISSQLSFLVTAATIHTYTQHIYIYIYRALLCYGCPYLLKYKFTIYTI